MEDLRVAAVTCHCPVGEIRHNLDKTAHWVARARATGASIVCFPELNISGYCLDQARYEAAADCYEQVVAELSALAGSTGMTILAGTVRPSGRDDRWAACHLAIQPQGSVTVYEKLHIAPPEKPVFNGGQHVPLVFLESSRTTFGMQLCYDAHFPELSTRMALDGAEILFMPHASPRHSAREKLVSWMRHLPGRAFDNSLFIVACNQCGENGTGLEFPGLALALGPSGEVQSRTLTSDGMLVADLSAAELEKVRGHDMRYFLPNRRPELYGTGNHS